VGVTEEDVSDQPTLFKPGPADGGLTDRQQLVLDMLEQNPHGLRPFDIGVALHQALSNPCSCAPGHACKWAPTDALGVLRSLRKRELAIGRKSGLWQLMDATVATGRPSDSRPTGYDPATAQIPF
jgi:hypothetical protein